VTESLSAHHHARTHTKPKLSTREQLYKSQIKASVLMIILVVLLVIIIYFVASPISNEYPRTMNQDVNMYAFEFNVPDILSEKMPISLEITSSDELEFYVLHEEDYSRDMTIVELRNYSINEDNRKTKHLIYDEELEPGKYVVVSYLQFETNNDIALTYTLDRYVPVLVIWLICLIFVLLFVICIVRIGLLQRKKSKLRREQMRQPEYAEPYRDRPEQFGYYDDPGPPPYGTGPVRPPPGPPPNYPPDPRGAPSGPPRPPQRSRRGPGPGYGPGPEPGPVPSESIKPSTIPCRCGEMIVVTDSLRPLRIQCPRCGRRGILEEKKGVPEDGIFY
jgi:uncharacterized membrane protein